MTFDPSKLVDASHNPQGYGAGSETTDLLPWWAKKGMGGASTFGDVMAMSNPYSAVATIGAKTINALQNAYYQNEMEDEAIKLQEMRNKMAERMQRGQQATTLGMDALQADMNPAFNGGYAGMLVPRSAYQSYTVGGGYGR